MYPPWLSLSWWVDASKTVGSVLLRSCLPCESFQAWFPAPTRCLRAASHLYQPLDARKHSGLRGFLELPPFLQPLISSTRCQSSVLIPSPTPLQRVPEQLPTPRACNSRSEDCLRLPNPRDRMPRAEADVVILAGSDKEGFLPESPPRGTLRCVSSLLQRT